MMPLFVHLADAVIEAVSDIQVAHGIKGHAAGAIQVALVAAPPSPANGGNWTIACHRGDDVV